MSSAYHALLQTRAGAKRTAHPTCRENQDRALVRRLSTVETGGPEAVLLAVADGVSRCPDGGAVADWIVRSKLGLARLFRDAEADPGSQLRRRLREFHHEFLHTFRDRPDMLESGCTLAAALLFEDRAIALWSGDSPVYHLQADGDGFHSRLVSRPDRDPFSGALTDCFAGVTGFALHHVSLSLSPGDIVLVTTDGIPFSGSALAESLGREGLTAAWIDEVCREAYARPNSDDMAIAAAQWTGHAGG